METIKSFFTDIPKMRLLYWFLIGVANILIWWSFFLFKKSRNQIKESIRLREEASKNLNKAIQYKEKANEDEIAALKKLILPGNKVTYVDGTGGLENGIVKEVCEDTQYVFVVFNCNDDWKNFKEYTGQRTYIHDLVKGWRK